MSWRKRISNPGVIHSVIFKAFTPSLSPLVRSFATVRNIVAIVTTKATMYVPQITHTNRISSSSSAYLFSQFLYKKMPVKTGATINIAAYQPYHLECSCSVKNKIKSTTCVQYNRTNVVHPGITNQGDLSAICTGKLDPFCPSLHNHKDRSA